MIPVEPKLVHKDATRVIFAKNQSEYVPLPAALDVNGLVMTEWELTAEELAKVLEGGRIRLWIHTFRQPLQPIALEVTAP